MSNFVNDQLSDQERVQLAKLEYQQFFSQQSIVLPNGRFLGKVWQLAPAGLRACAIVDSLADPREVTVLYRGSTMMPVDPDVWTHEWLDTNLPIGRALMSHQHYVPAQLRRAGRWLMKLLAAAPRAQFYLYGHSLGSINAQYAAIACRHPGRIGNAWLYEGSNVYQLLNDEERSWAVQLKGQLHQYIDPLDSLAIGYTDFQHVIGQLHYVDSVFKPRILQHMWGGYRYDDQGRLRLLMPDDPLVQASQALTKGILSDRREWLPTDDSQVIISLRQLMAKAAAWRKSLEN